jgi:membrane-associated phospholipid phosphatase
MQNIWPVEINVNLFLQSLGSWLTAPMQALTYLGSEQFFILFMPVILWCIDYSLGLRIGLILISSGQVNGVLKSLFHAPRPFWLDARVQPLSIETSFGMPSGHAMNTTSIFGRFAAGMNRRSITWICLVFIFLIGISRLYLGMHLPSDVIVGWILGGILLFAFVKLDRPVTRWFTSRSMLVQYLLVGLTTLIWIGLGLLPNLLVGDWQVPQIWIDNATRTNPALHPDLWGISGYITSAGIWMGVGFGAIWLSRRGGFDAGGSGPQLLYRFLVGLAGTFTIWMGLDQIFPDGVTPVALAFRLIRYTLVGIWVTGLAPALFIRFKWAVKKA